MKYDEGKLWTAVVTQGIRDATGKSHMLRVIIDYKSHRNVSALSLNEIEKQMLTYKILVQEVYPNKKVECMVIWGEDLTTSL